uniref:Uncharacterized protein n=1 Tax=Ciona savignyi TaxID=51511 RepID=H2Z4Q6_CIOSA
MFKVIAGCYEQLLMGYVVKVNKNEDEKISLTYKSSFTDHAQVGCIKCLSTGQAYIASGSTDETICLYDLEIDKELGCLQGHSGPVNQIIFPDKQRLISCSDDGTISIWEAKPCGNMLKSLKGHKGPVTSFAVHPSGKLGMSVSPKDGTLRTWNLLTGRSVYVKNMKKESKIEFIRWSHDGKYYISASPNVWSIFELEKAECILESKFDKPVLTIEFLPLAQEKNCIVAGDNDGNVSFYEVPSGRKMFKYKAHENRVKCIQPMIVPHDICPTDVVWLITVSSDEKIKIWDISQLEKNTEPECLLTIATGSRLTCVTMWPKTEPKSQVNEDLPIKEAVSEGNPIKHKRKRKRKPRSKEADQIKKPVVAT